MIVKFNVICTATYSSELELPNDIDKDNNEEVLDYIHEHLDECKVGDLEWLSDFEPDAAVTMNDIGYVYS